ncbi:MAG: DNA alkylation repair protein [Bacteroidales bacterium]|nr:DNA alkylation repair protein [Bacteroidales bacterium]
MINIEERLFELQDLRYRDFHSRLLPTAPEGYVIGVRMPQLRALAKEIAPEQLFETLPHRYYEENQLHAILLSAMKDYDFCLREVERFLPYVDNWATCDGLRPSCFARHTEELQPFIQRWMASEHEYTVRFSIGVLEAFFLDKAFHPDQLLWVAAVEREEYYIRMMQAWYFATALAKQWEATLPVVSALPDWVRRKAIQKACESFRVPQAHKDYLKSSIAR